MNKLSSICKENWFLAIILAFTLAACNVDSEKETANKTIIPGPSSPKEDIKKIGAGEDEYTEAKVDLGLSKEDIKYLMLSKTFPVGSHFKAIHEKIPDIKGIRPENGSDELASQGLTESKTKVTFLGKSTDLKFHFKNDSLYSFYYTITEPDLNKADRLYKGIQQFYNEKLGQGIELQAEEETRDVKTSIWGDTFPYGIMTYNINSGVITWGFQSTKP